MFQELETSVYIPPTIFEHTQCLLPVCPEPDTYDLQFIVYKNAKLFLELEPENTHAVVEGNVISAKIGKTGGDWLHRWGGGGVLRIRFDVLHHRTSEIIYSGTCVDRSPHWPLKSGLSRQVVIGYRFSFIEM